MKQVIMKRDFLGFEIQQMHDNKYFCLTDFVKVLSIYYAQRGQKFSKNIPEFMRRPDTIELIKAIQDNEGIAQVYISKKGKNGGTYAHPLLLIELAMYCDRDFKYKALQWVKDRLCDYGDSSGESYKTLSGVIDKALNLSPNKKGGLALAISQTARAIKAHIGVSDWDRATEYQLQARDSIHRDLCLLLEAGVDLTKSLEVVLSRNTIQTNIPAIAQI